MATLHFCNLSSEQFKTDSHWPVSACLGWFEVIWHSAFALHLDLATLVWSNSIEV